MRLQAHHQPLLALGIAVVVAVLAGCSSGGDTATTTTDARPRSTTTTAPREILSTDELPPPVGEEDDLLSGNMGTNTSRWLQLSVDESAMPNQLIAENYAQMPMDLTVEITKETNLRTEPAFPMRIAVKPLWSSPVAKLGALDEAQRWSFEYSSHYEMGDPTAKPTAFTYGSPLPRDVKAKAIAASGGAAGEKGRPTSHAYDFAVPEGTPVLAMRPGVIATIDQGFTEAGTDPERFAERGNSIRVLHDDGTWATYFGLSPRSSRVKIGDEVQMGDLLAVSGFTGLATEPHLSVAIEVNEDHVATSLPFELPASVTEPR